MKIIGGVVALQPEVGYAKMPSYELIAAIKALPAFRVKVLPGIQWRDQTSLLFDFDEGYALVTVDKLGN